MSALFLHKQCYNIYQQKSTSKILKHTIFRTTTAKTNKHTLNEYKTGVAVHTWSLIEIMRLFQFSGITKK